MHQSAKSNAFRNLRMVALACLSISYLVVGCSNGDSGLVAPVASGGAVGGASQSHTGGATQNSSGGTTQATSSAQNGGSTQAGSGGAVVATGGATAAIGGVTSSTGGSSVSGGTAGVAGAVDPCAPKTCSSTAACTAVKPTQELVSDFSNNTSDFRGTAVEWWKEFFGGTFVYPAPNACATTQPSNPLTQSFADGSWHITGTVGNYSGFGLWFAPCMADFSAYRGISFTVSGNVGSTGAVVMFVSTAATTKPGIETCSPNTATCVETSTSPCKAASKSIPVTATATPVTVLWSDLTDGSPEPTPGAAAITGISWSFDWLWSNTAADNYAVDIVIDDIKLVL